jgi:hypothetical protein
MHRMLLGIVAGALIRQVLLRGEAVADLVPCELEFRLALNRTPVGEVRDRIVALER